MSTADLVGGGSSENTSTSTATTQPESTTNTETTTQPEIKYPESFPSEFHGNPNVMKFYSKEKGDFDYGNMMTSLIHSQKMIGKDKIVVPSKDSSPDEWKEAFRKLGLPDRNEYKLGIEGVDETADDMTKGFVDKAHELGVLPQQAKGIVEYFNAAQKAQEEQAIQEAKDSSHAAQEALKQEWKGSYEDNINLVNQTIETLFTDEERQAAADAGYFADPLFVKMMHSVAPKLMDDNTLSGTAPRVGGFEGEQSLREEYQKVYDKMKKPEFRNSPELNRRLTQVLEQASKKGINLYG